MNNQEIRQEIKKNRVFNYEVAAKIGISDVKFSQWFRKKLTQTQIDKIKKAIKELKEGD